MASSAGHYTTAADPPQHSLNGPAQTSSSAMPRATFPLGKVSFQLQTPKDRGISGIVLNEFRPKQIERRPFVAVSAEREGNFARGPGPFMHYSHMQQRAKYLIPSLPGHSRVDELNRIHAKARTHELQRTMTLNSLELNEQRRQSRLYQAKAIMRNKSLSREVSQKLQASCSLPNLDEPIGDQTSVLQLLNRRVDINHLKKCRTQMAMQQKAEVVKQAVQETPELKELMADISRFEDDNLHDVNLVLETVVDWKNSTTISFGGDQLSMHM